MERTTLLAAAALLAFICVASRIGRLSRALRELDSAGAGSGGPLTTAATQARQSLGHLEDAERDLRSLEDRLSRANRGFLI